MLYQEAFSRIENFAKQTNRQFVFCGFNALSRVEEQLVRHFCNGTKRKLISKPTNIISMTKDKNPENSCEKL
jgi:hypothetical protein